MKITEETIKYAVSGIIQKNSLQQIRAELAEKKYTAKQIDEVVMQAKERIKAMAKDVTDIQRELNVYRLNLLATDPNAPRREQLTAIDLLNKMNAFYTTKVELDRNFKFVLGDESDDGFIVAENKRIHEQLQ